MRDARTEADIAKRANPAFSLLGISTSGGLHREFNTVFYFGTGDTGAYPLQVHSFVFFRALGILWSVISRHLVPVELIRVSHRTAGSTIAILDVAYAPANLGFWVGLPV